MGKPPFNALKVLERSRKVELKLNHNNKDYDNWRSLPYIALVLTANGLKPDFSRSVQ